MNKLLIMALILLLLTGGITAVYENVVDRQFNRHLEVSLSEQDAAWGRTACYWALVMTGKS